MANVQGVNSEEQRENMLMARLSIVVPLTISIRLGRAGKESATAYPGSVVEVMGTGHTPQTYSNFADAFAGKSAGLHREAAKTISDWLLDRQRK